MGVYWQEIQFSSMQAIVVGVVDFIHGGSIPMQLEHN